jgi:hypothetical protein
MMFLQTHGMKHNRRKMICAVRLSCDVLEVLQRDLAIIARHHPYKSSRNEA